MNLRALDNVLAIEVVKPPRKAFQFLERSLEQTHRPRKRTALHVVVRGRELDQALVEENEVVVILLEPELLPRFVGVPELAIVEEPDAVLESHRIVRRPWLASLGAASRTSPR